MQNSLFSYRYIIKSSRKRSRALSSRSRVTGVRILQSGGDLVFGPFRPRGGVICAPASAGECANAVYHPRGGQDLGRPTRLAVLLVGRRVGRRRQQYHIRVCLVCLLTRRRQPIRRGERCLTTKCRGGPPPSRPRLLSWRS